MQKIQGKKALLILGLIIVVLGSFLWWWQARKYVWTNDAYIQSFNVLVSPDIEARITKLYVDEGSIVKTGDIICDLDRSILQAKEKEALSFVELLQKKSLISKVHFEKKRDDYLIAQKEYSAEIIPFITYDHFEKDFRMAELDYRRSLAALENAEKKLGVIQEELRHTKVYAPRNGIIAKRWILDGDVAHFGQTLFVLNDLQNLWVTANLQETRLKRVKEGADVDIYVDAYPGRVFKGKVWVVKASAASKFSLIPPNNATGNFTKVVQRIPVKIHIEIPKTEPALYLFPGMSCEVYIRVR